MCLVRMLFEDSRLNIEASLIINAVKNLHLLLK